MTKTFIRAISIYDGRCFPPTKYNPDWCVRQPSIDVRSLLEGGVEKHRSWISLLGYCVATVLTASLAFASIVAGASLGFASGGGAKAAGDDFRDIATATLPPETGTTFTGTVTDSHCSVHHMRMPSQNASECARDCFRRGASYVLVDRERRYRLVGGEQSLNKLAGERVTVTGTRQGDAILVGSAAPVF